MKFKLADLIDCLECESDEFTSRLDLETGEVVQMDDTLVSAAEEGDDEALAAVPDWQKPDLELARVMAADAGKRFIAGPSKFDFHEYRHMERFIGTVENEREADELWRAIKGKGAFRYFKDTAERMGRLEDWWRYRDAAMQEFVRRWAEAAGVEIADWES